MSIRRGQRRVTSQPGPSVEALLRAHIPGPAIIVEDETSTSSPRLFTATIDPFGYINLHRRAS